MENKKNIRRKSGAGAQLRSPVVKRSPVAPVAQQGWLQKQGSEGLMLWKKRWCVLAEHCLFYYKTPEEDKLLGSILLPSYKVSPCHAEDKVAKKFAFKVEHTNMRTYIFAADTRESMVQWMSALSLATMLQDSKLNDPEDGGFLVTTQPQRKPENPLNGWVPYQPLYANAPPKPKRIGNESSPEPSVELPQYRPHPYQPNYTRSVANYQHPNQYYQGYHQLSSVSPQGLNSAPVRRNAPPRPHSADFLEYDTKKYPSSQTHVDVVKQPRPKSSLDVVLSNDAYYWSEESYAEKMRQSAVYLQQRAAVVSPVRQWDQNSFNRSASARLTRQQVDDDGSDEVTTYTGGEESMKRLLEWKQRMLASPLTRKPSGSSGRGSAHNELSKYYKQQVLRELERQEQRNRQEINRKRTKPDGLRLRSRSTDGRRSALASSNRYNSYSSDDEDKDSTTVRERMRKPRRTSDELKLRNSSISYSGVLSPDYENLTQTPADTSGRKSAPLEKSFDDGFLIKQENDFRSQNSKHDWKERLDESKLIKEFSYQYIKDGALPPTDLKVYKSIESPPENIVKSRIKQLGLENKEETLKEPLKVTTPTYLLNEAYVSSLKNSEDTKKSVIEFQERRNSKNLRSFALGTPKTSEAAMEDTSGMNSKSVKDLLASFEKKTDNAEEAVVGKRGVFTLTSSDDAEDNKKLSGLSTIRPCMSEDQTEEEGDEEVAAALGRRDAYFGTCRDISRKVDHTLYNKKMPKNEENTRRLSITDSMLANEDSESISSTPTVEIIKNLPKEIKHVEISEGHYMPMSPSRKTSAPPSDKSRSNSSLHSVLYGVDIEEMYVEMTEREQNKSHYDYLYKSISQKEPEYMEVPEDKKVNAGPPLSPRSALPDILNSSNAQAMKCDSSDADDESSKDLDSLDPPNRSRFSLSDTFRPASYYLGNIMGAVAERAAENQDSSDSDLVSPPPIPSSPPPLEDLDTSLEVPSLESEESKRLWEMKPDERNLEKKPDLDSIRNRSGIVIDEELGDINLDVYLSDLQIDDPQTYTKDFKSFEFHRNLAESFNKNELSDKSLSILSYEEDQKAAEEVTYENLQIMFPPPPPELYESSEHSDRDTSLSLYKNLPPPANYCDAPPVEPDNKTLTKVRFDPDTLMLKDTIDNQAPYYYSDIIKHDEFVSSERTRVQRQPLNNQRGSSQESLPGLKRNDIGRKVNPINQSLSQSIDETNEVEKIAAELRTTSVDFMGDAADKSSSVDVKNIYESDTLQRCKQIPVTTRIRTPDFSNPQGIVRNLYPLGIRNKSDDTHRAQSSDRLLDVTVRRTPCDDLWDEDNLWRESLRRVSRSLDNLDETRTSSVTPQTQTSASSGRRSVDPTVNRPKLSRGVTYVNDVVRRDGLADYEQDYRDGRRLKKGNRVLELSDSGLQECDDGVHYERLKREPARVSENTNTLVELIEPIDRERLRQWDLMSSGNVDQPSTSSGNAPNVTVNQQQSKSTNPEASATGSVLRENHMPPSKEQQEDIHSTWQAPQIMLTQDSPQDQHGSKSLDDRSHYFERGKSSHHNGIAEHRDAYSPYSDDSPIITSESAINRRTPTNYSSTRVAHVSPRYSNNPVPHATQSISTGTLPYQKSKIPAGSVVHLNSGTLPFTKNSPYGYEYSGKRDQPVTSESEHWGLDVSAGELLGRTHEELVLLLIQLRRQSASVCKAMETCHTEIEAQARLTELDTPKRLEHLQKLEELKRHLLELERQYEKGKPLVNLVDNMVKLGSLYRGNSASSPGGAESGDHVREKLEFNQKVQEQRMLAEERREWDRLSPDQTQLQAKVQQLYRLDRLLQEESGALQSLQQDKELLERALGGLRHKMQITRGNQQETDRCRQQQKLLQKELSRVRLLLAHNSKKLEETVSENARLEQELVILRQKLQANRLDTSHHMTQTQLLSSHSRRTPSYMDSSPASATTATLEAELRRVQSLVGDLQRQREELSVQVRQLTEKSDTLVHQIRPGPTGVAGAAPIPASSGNCYAEGFNSNSKGKKKSSAPWFETDLDQMQIQDSVVIDHQNSVNTCSIQQNDTRVTSPIRSQAEENRSTTPIYINTDITRKEMISPSQSSQSANENEGQFQLETSSPVTYCTPVELSEADDRMKRYYGLIPREKQEIKTVRIVKRESERRQRDRDRTGNIGLPITAATSPTSNTAKRVPIVDEIEEEPVDVFANFHPSNPFLPQNMDQSPTGLRTMSLPRGFGAKIPSPPVRTDTASLKASAVRRNRQVRFGNDPSSDWSSSDSPLVESSPTTTTTLVTSPITSRGTGRPLSAREQLFGASTEDLISPQLSPVVYQSEAAKEIVQEMASMETRRRQVPREKRRHHTVSNIRVLVDPDRGASRSRDDLDMERALRPRINAPDVVRSTLSQKDLKYNERTIDTILGTPNKIVIPERYIPEQEPILTAEEQLHRLRKAESIRKMLSETSTLSTPDLSAETPEEEKKTSTLKKKVEEEKKQREHLLALNQILAQQVMEKSKLVAVKALAQLPLDSRFGGNDDDDLSPIQPLPLYQQRENFYS